MGSDISYRLKEEGEKRGKMEREGVGRGREGGREGESTCDT